MAAPPNGSQQVDKAHPPHMARRLVVGTFVALMLFSACADEPTVDLATERVAIREVWDEINAAFLAKDWARYSQLFVTGPDFQMVHPGQRDWIDGSEEFWARYEPLVTGEGQWSFETTRFDLRFSPKGDAAWAMIEFIFSAEGGPEILLWEFVVFTRTDGAWRVASAMAASVPD